MKKIELLYEGKAKKIYSTEDQDLVIQEFKDDATAFDGKKKGTILGKGVINNRMSSHFFEILEEQEISTHFVEVLSDRDMLVKNLKIFPIEVVVRNIVAGSLVKRTGLEEGTVLKNPIIEEYYKNDELGDPIINSYHVSALQLANADEESKILEMGARINSILQEELNKVGIDLVDFKLEFGLWQNHVLLGDEISPDTCRFWDKDTGKKLDKDRFRFDLGDVEGTYQTVFNRICGTGENPCT
jgi:phosphoribosylaminoimidazole-succinocarboxamide synthase